MTALMRIRKNKGLERKELAQMTGISFRTIQDYEQGHKKISSAGAASLYKLSLALGCSMEDLIEDSMTAVNTKAKSGLYNNLSLTEIEEIEKENIFSEEYKVNAKWKFIDNACYIEFAYNGEIVLLPFNAVFSTGMTEWLKEAAILKIEEYIEDVEFEEKYGMRV
ncbi:MAG: helix-turn-helix transcriptional regulator [Eubacterium sp.]|nr:helix-turn-helix transcriptional regulator [Eubacterium sp.]